MVGRSWIGFRIVSLLVASTVSGCDAYEHTNPLDPEYPLTLSVSGPDSVFSLNDTIQFQVLTDAGNASLPFTWSTSDLGRFPTVEGTAGKFESRSNGTFIIAAAYGPHSAEKQVVVAQRAVEVAISPPTTTELNSLGETLNLTAGLVDAKGTPVPGSGGSGGTALAWSSSDPAVLEVTSGRATARANGSAWVRVSGLTFADSLRITVRQTPASLAFGNTNYNIPLPGGSVQTILTARDGRNNVIPSPAGLTLSSSRSTFVVLSNGLVQANSYGSSLITARLGDLQASTTVRVTGGTAPTVTDLDAGLTGQPDEPGSVLIVEFTARDTELDLDGAILEVYDNDAAWLGIRNVTLPQGQANYSTSVAFAVGPTANTVRVVVRDAGLHNSALTSWPVTAQPAANGPGVQLLSATRDTQNRLRVTIQVTSGNGGLRNAHLLGFDSSGSLVYHQPFSAVDGTSVLNAAPDASLAIADIGVVVSDSNGVLSFLRRAPLTPAPVP